MALNWCSHQGSNLKSSDYESGALTLLSYANNLVQGSCAAGVDVSCSTSLPKSPDRIAGIKKPRRDAEANFTNWYVTIIFMPPLKVKAAYQSRLKYDAFNPVLQDMSLNLSPFVVNVIALPATEHCYQGAARLFSSPPTAP